MEGSSLFGDRVLRLASVQTKRQQNVNTRRRNKLKLVQSAFCSRSSLLFWCSMASRSLCHRNNLVLFISFLCVSPHSCGAAKRGRKYLREAVSGDGCAPEPAASSTDPSPRKGVQRMRQNFEERAAEGDTSPIPENPDDVALTNDLKYLWAKGELSSSAVQSLASAAQRQCAKKT